MAHTKALRKVILLTAFSLLLIQSTRSQVLIDLPAGYNFGKGEGMNLSLRFSHGLINSVPEGHLVPERNRGIHVHVGMPIGMGMRVFKKSSKGSSGDFFSIHTTVVVFSCL